MKPGGRKFTGQKARVVLGSRHGQCSDVTIENDDCLSLLQQFAKQDDHVFTLSGVNRDMFVSLLMTAGTGPNQC